MELTVRKLHLGCGSVILPGWENLDISPPPGGIVCDLRRSLPHETNTVDYIYHEHFLEHLSRAEGLRMFRECFRVLRNGGVMRFSTPDLGVIAGDYLNGEIGRWKGTWEPKSKAEMLNGALRNWDHQFVYDRDEVVSLLTEAGFSTWQFVAYRESVFPELRGLECRPFFMEIIMEVFK